MYIISQKNLNDWCKIIEVTEILEHNRNKKIAKASKFYNICAAKYWVKQGKPKHVAIAKNLL